MPETTIYEHRDFTVRKSEVGLSRKPPVADSEGPSAKLRYEVPIPGGCRSPESATCYSCAARMLHVRSKVSTSCLRSVGWVLTDETARRNALQDNTRKLQCEERWDSVANLMILLR